MEKMQNCQVSEQAADRSESPALSVRHVSKEFSSKSGHHVIAIDDVSFDIAENEVCALVGPSGCGKSTLLRMVAGLDEPTVGEILAHGEPVTDTGSDRGMIFQAYTSFPWLTVRENVEYGMRLNGVPYEERHRRAERFMELVHMSDFADTYTNKLSGGMRQRVAIARTLANDPYMLLMDEPFGALDAVTRGLMQELLLEVMRTSRNTVVIVTHDIEEALFLANRVIFLSARPGTVKADLITEFKRDKEFHTKEELIEDAGFQELWRQILAMMRAENFSAEESSG